MASNSTNYELKDIKSPQEEGESQDERKLPEVMVLSSRGPSGRESTPVGNQIPFDKYKMVYYILLIHGVGSLMPWNMFINANDYFKEHKFKVDPEHPDAEATKLQKYFLNYLGVASQVPNLLFNGLNLLINLGSGNLNFRVNLTLFIEAIIFLITIILACLDSSQWKESFFYATMISVIILNMASGVYQNCVFGTGAKFPSKYTNAILIGSNLSGTFASTVNLLSLWLAPELATAAIYYFATALLVIILCLVTYNLLPTNAYFKYHDKCCQANNNHLDITSTTERENSSRELIKQRSNKTDEIPELLRETVDAMVPRPQEPKKVTFMSELRGKWEVFLKCWPQCLNVFLTFYVSLALFPSVLANTSKSEDSIFSLRYFTPVACFFVFNVFAMIGNLISNWTTWPGKNHVWLFVVARFLFIPFFIFCNFNQNSRKWPVLIRDDFSFIIGNILLATSSGYLSSLCMMFASAGLQGEEASKAGMIAAFFLILGIFTGINSSFILTWIVEL